MSKLTQANDVINQIQQQAGEDLWMNQIYPLFKLILTCVFLTVTMSIPKYQLAVTLAAGIYPVVVMIIGEIPFGQCIYRLRVVLPIVCLLGLVNPIFDRSNVLLMNQFVVSGGVISFITLTLKGIWAVLAVYLLVVTTGMDKICGALKQIYCPLIIITILWLIYRYISLMLLEAERMVQAYSLRAPGQKGIAMKAWGSFVGLLLLRTFDRGDRLYQSMLLRGFTGSLSSTEDLRMKAADWLYFFILLAMILLFRFVPIFYVVGNLFF